MTADARTVGDRHPLGRFQKPALVIGVVGLVVLLAGAFVDQEQFFRSYLFGFVFWVTVAVGCLGLLMIQALTGGVWGILIRRVAEAGSRTLPLLLLMFVPLAFGLHSIYEWSHPEALEHDAILQHKEPYLNAGFFLVRTVLYFAIWIVTAYLINRWGRDYEQSGDAWTKSKIRRISAGGLIALALTLTFASVDWLMSLEPHWFSTMYGISFMIHALLAGMAFCIMITVRTWIEGAYAGVIRPVQFRDLGNFQLAFVMLWAYTAFSEFMLIWYGNLLEEIPYFLRRTSEGWGVVALLIVIFHFFLPFGMLLMRKIKDHPRTLRIVAALLLVMHAVDLYWLIVPAFHEKFFFGWMYPVALIGLGGIWMAVFFWQLGRSSVLPVHEPYVQAAIAGEAVSHG
jgi:hypothetical protein